MLTWKQNEEPLPTLSQPAATTRDGLYLDQVVDMVENCSKQGEASLDDGSNNPRCITCEGDNENFSLSMEQWKMSKMNMLDVSEAYGYGLAALGTDAFIGQIKSLAAGSHGAMQDKGEENKENGSEDHEHSEKEGNTIDAHKVGKEETQHNKEGGAIDAQKVCKEETQHSKEGGAGDAKKDVKEEYIEHKQKEGGVGDVEKDGVEDDEHGEERGAIDAQEVFKEETQHSEEGGAGDAKKDGKEKDIEHRHKEGSVGEAEKDWSEDNEHSDQQDSGKESDINSGKRTGVLDLGKEDMSDEPLSGADAEMYCPWEDPGSPMFENKPALILDLNSILLMSTEIKHHSPMPLYLKQLQAIQLSKGVFAAAKKDALVFLDWSFEHFSIYVWTCCQRPNY